MNGHDNHGREYPQVTDTFLYRAALDEIQRLEAENRWLRDQLHQLQPTVDALADTLVQHKGIA